MAPVARIVISPKSKKKYQATISKSDGSVTTVHFGDKKFKDFTMHKDPRRKARYLLRSEPNQDWTIDGLETAGFWSRWLLWNKPTIRSSIVDLNSRFQGQLTVSFLPK